MSEDPPKERHQHDPLIFPEGFLWGSATSSYQVEGNNTNADWWQWGEDKSNIPPSGIADNQYELFEKDFKMAKELGHKAHRLSVEWSRIEKEDGVFDEDEIRHYQQVLKTLKDQGMTVMLTLHHFTNPIWFADKGGWENHKAPYYFNRFVKKVLPYFKEYVDLWVTINEPSVYSYCSYITGIWPPQVKSDWRAFWVLWNMIQAHKKVYKTIHKSVPKAKVGIAHNVSSFSQLHKHSFKEGVAVWLSDITNNHLLYFLSGKKYHDFLGLNYYFNRYISFNGQSRIPHVIDVSVTKKDVTDMGWEIRPEGIFDAIMDFSDYHLPIYITENGLASTNDDRRCRFLISYLKEIFHAIATGADVRGYFHWSLLDNYEWSDGYKPRFGLVEVDYRTQKRTPRLSAYVYKRIIENNGIPHSLLIFQGHTINAADVLKKK